VYIDGPLRVLARRSTDYGATWDDPTVSLKLVFDPAHTYIDSTYYTNNGIDSITVYSDTVVAPSNMVDVIIDSDGLPHYVGGQILTYIIQKGVADPTVQNGRRGIIYDVDEDAMLAGTAIWYYKDGDQYIYTVGLTGDGSRDWDGQGHIVSRRAYTGPARYPQLGIDPSDNLYLAYATVKSGDFVAMDIDTTPRYVATEPDTLTNVNGLFGHIYLAYKYKNYPQWSVPTDMTPTGVNCLFPSVCDNVVDGRMYVGYSAASVPGDRVTNVELEAVPAEIYVNAFDISMFPPISDVSDEGELSGNNVVISPNPVDEFARVVLSGVTASEVSVSLVNANGTIVGKSVSPSNQNGQMELIIPTRHLASGTYLVVLEAGAVITTQTLSVVH
jgi:hypothetical protein